MAFARDTYTATGGQTDFTITFSYQEQSHVLVYQEGSLLTLGAGNDYIFSNATTIQLNTGATNGDAIVIQRSTSQSTRLVDFTTGTLTEADLDNSAIQMFYFAQEVFDLALKRAADDTWDAESIRIKNVAAPTSDNDAATKDYVDTAALGSLSTPLSIANGGTAAATADAALTSLGGGTAGIAVFKDSSAEDIRVELEVDRPVQTKTGNYTQVATDVNNMIRWTSAGDYDLLAASTAGSDFSVDIMADGGDVSIDPNGSENINGGSTSHTVSDGTSGTLFCDGTQWFFLAGGGGGGGGLFKGENGEVGSAPGDIFRINELTLNTDVTIDADENASCTGPLTVASGVTLTVTSGGTVAII